MEYLIPIAIGASSFFGRGKTRKVYVDNPEQARALQATQAALQQNQQALNEVQAALAQQKAENQRIAREQEEKLKQVIRENNERLIQESEQNRQRLAQLASEYESRIEQSSRELQQLHQKHSEDIQKLQQMANELNEVKEQARREKDPQMFRQFRNQAIDRFIEQVRCGTLKLVETIPKAFPDERHIAFIGPISSGKSTIIKALTGVNVRTGMGHTTSECSLVYSNLETKLFVWDAPGINEDFDFYDPQTLGFIKSLHKVFVVFNTSIKSVDNVIRVCSAITKNVIFVRSQCDNWIQTDELSIAQELSKDVAELSRLGFADPIVVPVSARNVIANNPEIFSWGRLQEQVNT